MNEMYNDLSEVNKVYLMKFVNSFTGSSIFNFKEHPRRLIPELCKQFYDLGWVTGEILLNSLNFMMLNKIAICRNWRWNIHQTGR